MESLQQVVMWSVHVLIAVPNHHLLCFIVCKFVSYCHPSFLGSCKFTKPPFKCSGFLEVTSPQPASYSLFLSWDHLRFRLASCFLATFSCCCKSLRCPTSMHGNMARKRRKIVGCTGCSIVFVVFVGGYPWIHGSSCVLYVFVIIYGILTVNDSTVLWISWLWNTQLPRKNARSKQFPIRNSHCWLTAVLFLRLPQKMGSSSSTTVVTATYVYIYIYIYMCVCVFLDTYIYCIYKYIHIIVCIHVISIHVIHIRTHVDIRLNFWDSLRIAGFCFFERLANLVVPGVRGSNTVQRRPSWRYVTIWPETLPKHDACLDSYP